MTESEIIKQLFLSYNSKDEEVFYNIAREYIAREKRKNRKALALDLEKALFTNQNGNSSKEKRFKNEQPIPRDSEKGFPLLEIKKYTIDFEKLILSNETKNQLEQIIQEFKDSDILSTYNLSHKKKILLCGKPGTGKTFSVQAISSVLNLPLVYVRFDSIISSYLGETASNLRKVFDFIENGTWIVLFDEFDIIGKNRDDIHEHGEIKRVVNNFLQILDNFQGNSILFAATNHQSMLDSAIWRRFDEIVYYELPNEELRTRLFENYLRPIKKEKNLNFFNLMRESKGLSPSDIKMIVEEAIKKVVIQSKNIISQKELDESMEKFLRREKVKNNQMGDR